MRPDLVNRGRESEDTGFRHHPALRPSCKATVPARLSNWEIIHARRPTGGERARASDRHPAASNIPSDCRYHGRQLEACRVAGRRNRSASQPGGRPGSRCKDPARGHERGLRRQRRARRLGLEGRLRSGRSRDGAVHPALRPPHAPRGGRRTRIGCRHARHAGDPGGSGAVPDKAVGGTACPATVLHPLAVRLRRDAGRRHPPRRHRAGALGRHRHARRYGRMRARQARQRRAASERNRDHPGRVCQRRSKISPPGRSKTSPLNRHSPYTIQIRGNRTTFPPPRNCIPYAAIRWHDFGNRPALGRPLGHFSRHPDTPLLSLSPRRRFPRPTPERVFVADHQSSSGFSGTGPSAPPPQPIGT